MTTTNVQPTKGAMARVGYSDGSGLEYITINDKAVACVRWGCDCCKASGEPNREETFHAELHVDAFNTHTLTGLTPSELVKHIDNLMDVIRELLDGAAIVERENGVLVRGVTAARSALTNAGGGK